MGNLGFQELLLIAAVALFVFGPDRLPELARQAGKAIARFRRETSSSIAELKRAADLDELDAELRSLRRDIREVRSSVVEAVTADPATPRPSDAPPPVDPDAT
ncbi:MAG: Sec-independent protein translocase protein TatB [Nitriliruptorales bacterium]|nr:Sec-independent protein translocase protein TatB [Nitriliruptorales bacterium]